MAKIHWSSLRRFLINQQFSRGGGSLKKISEAFKIGNLVNWGWGWVLYIKWHGWLAPTVKFGLFCMTMFACQAFPSYHKMHLLEA